MGKGDENAAKTIHRSKSHLQTRTEQTSADKLKAKEEKLKAKEEKLKAKEEKLKAKEEITPSKEEGEAQGRPVTRRMNRSTSVLSEV